MIITKEMALEELKRRGLLNQETQEPQEPKQSQSKSFLDKAGGIAGKFNNLVENTHIPEFAGGLLQGAGDIGASLGNVIARPLGHPIPHPNLKQYIPHGLGSNVAFGAGELSSQLPLLVGGAGLAGKALGLGEKAGLSGRVAEGAITGGLTGENQEGNGRALGAIEGAAIPNIGALARGVNSMRPKNIANAIKNTETEKVKKYAGEFNTIFKEGKQRGVDKGFKEISANEQLLKRGGKNDYLYSLEKYKEKPSFKNAHNAQSDLNKYVADIGKPTSTLERHARDEAKKVAKTLREHIADQLHRSGNVDLALDYNLARNGFKNEVVPYTTNKALQSFKKGNLTHKDFVKKILKDETFKAKAGIMEHPELYQSESIKKLLTSKPLQLGAAAGASYLGLNKLSKFLK